MIRRLTFYRAVKLSTRSAQQTGRLRQCRDAVRVETAQTQLSASRVVVAVPPLLLSEIDFRPKPPEPLQRWHHNLSPGRVIKCFAVYERPFWRDDGYSGSAVGDKPPLHVAFDGTAPQGQKAILLGFIE